RRHWRPRAKRGDRPRHRCASASSLSSTAVRTSPAVARPFVPALGAGAGVLAGVVVAVLAARHTGITEHSPVRPPGSWRDAWTWGLVGAFVLYVAGLALLRRRRGPLAPVLALAMAIQLVPLAAPLLLSTDAYSY